MRKVLYILGQLDDMDVDWLSRNGIKRRIDAGTAIVRQGQPVQSLFVLLEGRLGITVKGLGHIASVGPGELIGELSFVDRAPPSATVAAEGECVVLEVDKKALEAKLAADPAFGHRFFRALALFLADRLRGTMQRMGYGGDSGLDSEEILEDELDDNILDGVSLAGDRFDRLLRTLSEARTA
ncbi:hypothetical protein DLREEDagrD3_11420 [Denitratisoma sp. agr-D3]